MKFVKSLLALLLSAALMTSVVQGQFSVVSAAGTSEPTATPTLAPTNTPALTPTAAPSGTPNPTATAGTTGTPKATATAKPTATPTPKIKNKRPKAPKISCKAGKEKGTITVTYKAVKNAKGLEIRWYKGGDKKNYRYNLVHGKEIDGTFWVEKGKRDITELKKGKYTVMVRAYSVGSDSKHAWITRGSLYSKWVKKTVTVKKSGSSSMNYNEG